LSKTIPFDLYLVTDRNQCRGRPLIDVVRTALEAGVRAVQLRERDLPTRELLALAESLKRLADRSGARLLINDRIDLCLALSAAGVHLRSDHFPISRVRKLLGPRRLIGVSCHSVQDAIEAEAAGADFAVLGPIYETASKRPYGPPLGTGLLRAARAASAIPLLAIGGVRADRIPETIEAGASGAAVISAILGAEDVRASTRELIRILESEKARGPMARY
jgi:thiamine-phosphate pyrophosphorylase